MAITDHTRKLLWARSGNRCAFCRRVLIEDAAAADRESIVGDEAHIFPRKPGGPRGDGTRPADIDGYSNLILLCKSDHKRVDDQPSFFTIERLNTLKEAHETWVHTTLDQSISGSWILRSIRRMRGLAQPTTHRPEPNQVGEYQAGLGKRHRYLRQAILELDPRTMADFYGFSTVAELERYEAGNDEFPAEALKRLRETFFIYDEYLRGTWPFIFSSLRIEQAPEIHGLLDAGFQLCFLCSPKKRDDLLTYPYLHKVENGMSRGVIANRLSSFSRASGGGAANIYDMISLMLSRRMSWADVQVVTVRDYEWDWLESSRFHMGEYGPALYTTDRECQERFYEMFLSAAAPWHERQSG